MNKTKNRFYEKKIIFGKSIFIVKLMKNCDIFFGGNFHCSTVNFSIIHFKYIIYLQKAITQ